jgi:NADP-dependent 3-hydroxy acid dehydrogenase YdfG
VEAVSVPTAVVTGASSGIGAATARALAADGFRVVLGARRLERLERLAAEIGGEALALDVTDPASVAALAVRVPGCEVLVNNAGGAFGLEPLAAADEELWRRMYETNVLGTMRMTRALLPRLIESGNGHVVTVTSIAAFEVYRGGAGYSAAKHAQRAALRTLRLELLGHPVSLTEVAPGMVETEFSVVRLGGDEEAAAKVYAGMEPLRAEDVAECIRWAVAQPPHVNVDEIVVRPRDQATAAEVHREG